MAQAVRFRRVGGGSGALHGDAGRPGRLRRGLAGGSAREREPGLNLCLRGIGQFGGGLLEVALIDQPLDFLLYNPAAVVMIAITLVALLAFALFSRRRQARQSA